MASVTLRLPDGVAPFACRTLAGFEQLGEPTRLRVELVATTAPLPPNVVGEVCALDIELPHGARTIHGVVTEVARVATSQPGIGRRYELTMGSAIEHRGGPGHVLLFVRPRRTDARGLTMPYAFLGPAFYKTHRGGRPMQIEWELERPMPAGLYQETKVAAG